MYIEVTFLANKSEEPFWLSPLSGQSAQQGRLYHCNPHIEVTFEALILQHISDTNHSKHPIGSEPTLVLSRHATTSI